MNYVCAAFECASAVILVYGLEKEKTDFGRRKFAVYMIVYLLYFTIIRDSSFAVELSSISYVMFFIYVKIVYKNDFFHTLTLVVISSVMVSLVELIVICILPFFIMAGPETGVYEVLVTAITLVIVCLLTRTKIQRLMCIIEKCSFTYVVVCILSLMIFTPSLLLKVVQKLDVGDYFYIAICIGVMWLLVFRIQKYELESKIRRQYFESYKNVINQIRRRQHKIKNQLNAAYGMYLLYDNYEELVEKQKEYLSRILEYELPNDAIVLEEPSIIALIYEKINEAIDRGIRMETSFRCSMADSRLSDVLWVEIIGTLFDNAIEALEKYEGEKKIWLSIYYMEGNKRVLQIANTFHELKVNEIGRFFEMGYSTKGEGRGIGLYNVRELVYKYRGDITAMSTEIEGWSVMMFKVII